MIARVLIVALTLLLVGCDLESLLADPKVVQREADSKAIGSACRTGDCGECKVRRMEGDVVVANCDGLGEDEVADGYVLSCVAAVNGRVTVAA